jgi:hypothetical protein
MKTIIAAVLLSCCFLNENSAWAFAPAPLRPPAAAGWRATSTKIALHTNAPLFQATTTTRAGLHWMTLQAASSLNDDNDGDNQRGSTSKKMRQRVKRLIEPLGRRFIDTMATVAGSIRRRRRLLAFALAITSTTGGLGGSILPLKQAHAASAPVMALPKAESRDPASEALMERDRKLVQIEQDELADFARRGREIEAQQGEAARVRFEKEYQAQRQQQAANRISGLEKLKRNLLDQGLCPFTDMEAKRQVILFEKNVDLADVQGTPFYLERQYENSKSPKVQAKSEKVKKAPHRAVIACMVQDLKNRDMDPLQYFEKRQEQTFDIMDLSPQKAAALLQEYRANLELYGQITVPKEGETSAKEKMAAAAKAALDPKAAKAEAQRVKALAQAEAKAEKQRLQQEKKALKEHEKQAKLAAQQAEKEAKLEAAAAAAAALLPTGEGATTAVLDDDLADSADASEEGELASMDEEGAVAAVTDVPSSIAEKNPESKIKIVKAASVFVAAGGGAYALQMYRNKKAADEAERQRQFKLLMDGASPKTAPALALEETDITATTTTTAPLTATTAAPPPAPVTAPAAPKKRLGFFGKKKNTRETDLSVLVSADAAAPAFASLLAQILTYGAPGRFPAVVDMMGGIEKMPMQPLDGEFDLDLAKQLLVEGTTKAGLAPAEYAEIFANVVNCMLIDIVDLASTSLKEKESQLTVDAINIVVEFMNHAASLYDAVAGGVAITPVTYGGALSKSKLEQMYSAYAVSGMSNMENMPGDFDSRVGLLADVFEINSKKAEGLMMKAMQKNMMEMMKSGEGMEELMKGMGGMEGMNGLMGEGGMGGMGGEDADPEQLKAMLTELKKAKDAGEISDKDLAAVKDMFKDSFGMSMDDLMKSDEISGTDKEVLDLMKDVLYN